MTRILALLVTLAALLAPAAQAQNAPAPEPAPVPLPVLLTPDEIDKLLAGLSDEQVRQVLIDQLYRQAAEQARPAQSENLATQASEVTISLRDAVGAVSEIPAGLDAAGAALAPHLDILALGIVLILAGSLVAEGLFRRLTRPLYRQIDAMDQAGPLQRLGVLTVRLVIEGLTVAVWFLGAFTTYAVAVEPAPMPVQFTLAAIFYSALIVRGISVASRFLLAPHAPGLRLFALGDTAARRLHQGVLFVAILGTYGASGALLLHDLGMSANASRLIIPVFGLIVTAFVVFGIVMVRRPVADAIRGDTDENSLRAMIGGVWYLVAIAYVLLVWGVWTVNGLMHADTEAVAARNSLLLLIAVPVIDRLARLLFDGLFHRRDEDEDTARRKDRIVGHVMVGVRVVLAVVVAGMLLQSWGVPVEAWLATPLGERAVRAFIDIAAAGLITYLLWDWIRTAIDRRAQPAGPAGPGDEGGAHGATRLQTLLPLARTFIAIVLLVMVAMVTLSSLGVDIGPLLAGAGVVGLALGLGAQKLVQDIVSGIFFLIDDAFRAGEYIEVGEYRGTVESLSVRSMRLRHHLGPVQTIPFSEIQAVRNLSRDWVIMKLELRVPFDTDTEKVRKLIKNLGKEMLKDETLGPNFLEPLKSQGVTRMEDSAMIIRVKFTSRPGEQWVLRREVYRRIQELFKANGIEFATRKVTVDVGGGDPKLAAAAAEAVRQSEEDQKGGPAPAPDSR